jgi:phosphohistidine swiveling domain-containing protein
MSLTVRLTDPGAECLELCGGKATGLARLVRQGFSVPPALVVTTQLYKIVANTGARRGDLLSAPLPPELEDELSRFVEDGVAYAVRSSATLEDLGEASFAGQHDTVLGCTGLPAILQAIRVCFASAWQERAVAYRRHHAITADPAMAVIVQRMVDAQAAGVAFTIDPVGGALDEIHISAHPGLGEAVVNGEAEVDRFVLAKADLAVRAMATPRATPCLTAAQAASVAGMARAVEAQAGFPQDVEWAIDAAGVQVLQARPVTALPARWTRDESAERFPNPVTPLAWDFAEAGFHDALAASFVRMGLPKLRAKWFAAFDGYVYGNQTAVDLYLGQALVPTGSLDALRAQLPELVRRFTWLLELPGEWERSLDRFLLEVGRLGAETLDGLQAGPIWEHIGRINATGRRYFRHNIAISVGHSAVHKALRALLAALDADTAYDALMAPVRTRTGQVNAALDHLAALAREQPGLALLLRDNPAATVLAGAQLDAYPAFEAVWTALLQEHGHRELDFDPYHPGWADAPWAALEAVRARLDSKLPMPRDQLADRLAAETALRGLTAGLPDDLALLLSELVRLARLYTELDDTEHYHTARLGPLLRRAVAALGQAPAAAGTIEQPLDLFFAHEADLAEAVAQDRPDAWRRLATTLVAAKQAYARQCQASPPWTPGGMLDVADATGGLIGIPGSPGRAEGPAYIVRSPDDFAACPAGAILVVRATTPAWTALFAKAAGIVAESGGPLSHGAIAAREHGIPAVMGVRGVMGLLSNGQAISLDGGRGLVNVLSS